MEKVRHIPGVTRLVTAKEIRTQILLNPKLSTQCCPPRTASKLNRITKKKDHSLLSTAGSYYEAPEKALDGRFRQTPSLQTFSRAWAPRGSAIVAPETQTRPFAHHHAIRKRPRRSLNPGLRPERELLTTLLCRIPSFTHSLIHHSFIHSFARRLTHLFIYISAYLFTDLLIPSLVASFTTSLLHSHARAVIHIFVCFFIHSKKYLISCSSSLYM